MNDGLYSLLKTNWGIAAAEAWRRSRQPENRCRTCDGQPECFAYNAYKQAGSGNFTEHLYCAAKADDF